MCDRLLRSMISSMGKFDPAEVWAFSPLSLSCYPSTFLSFSLETAEFGVISHTIQMTRLNLKLESFEWYRRQLDRIQLSIQIISHTTRALRNSSRHLRLPAAEPRSLEASLKSRVYLGFILIPSHWEAKLSCYQILPTLNDPVNDLSSSAQEPNTHISHSTV